MVVLSICDEFFRYFMQQCPDIFAIFAWKHIYNYRKLISLLVDAGCMCRII